MRVAVDQPGQDQLAFGIDGLLDRDAFRCLHPELGGRTDESERITAQADNSIFDHAARGVHGDDGGVGHQQIETQRLLFCGLRMKGGALRTSDGEERHAENRKVANDLQSAILHGGFLSGLDSERS